MTTPNNQTYFFSPCQFPGMIESVYQTTMTTTQHHDQPWRSFDYEELIKRDKVNLDIFWLKDKSLEDSESLPEPEVLAQEIVDDLQTAMEQFAAIQEGLNNNTA